MYQKTKQAADDVARDYAVSVLHISTVYPGFGFGCSWASSHPSTAEMTLLRMAARKPVDIMGSGRNRLCLAYYRDTPGESAWPWRGARPARAASWGARC